MRVDVLGGGPAGLFSAILLRKSFPSSTVSVFERNLPDDTFGWGVVFSDETLGNIEAADPVSFGRIRARFRSWTEIDTWHHGVLTKSTGHGFVGLSRKDLLAILHERCRELDVGLQFQTEVKDLQAHQDADLILVSDGVNSRIREILASDFRPSLDWRKCKFTWLGTSKPLNAFTFVFKESRHGLFQVHAYPFQDGLSTWIVECREETWKRAGLDQASEAETIRYCEDLFAGELDGHPLLSNRSIWRTFPTISCERWYSNNVVLMGDAAHTAHFSIGSGTKLAMEDAITLDATLRQHGTRDIKAALVAYDTARRPEVVRLQRAAQTSLEWFENSERYRSQAPDTFVFNLMTRSKRITFENLRKRDPSLVERAAKSYQATHSPTGTPASPPRAPAFVPFRARDVTFCNRLVVSPMCQYSAIDGVPTDWHLVHLGSRALGGAGLVFTEMTNVAAEGRITEGCTGLWNDVQLKAFARIVRFVHTHSKARIGIQLAHAGRKGSVHHPFEGGPDVPLSRGGWQTLAPSALAFDATWPAPKAMDDSDRERVLHEFLAATDRAAEAGFDVLELHAAHGYLLGSYLSPLSNRRSDAFGGSAEKRMRWPLEVVAQCRERWPKDRPLFVRISATDWVKDGGFTADDSIVLAKALKERGTDVVDVSTGGSVPDAKPVYGRMYQLPFAERIRFEAEVPVMTVGAIQSVDHANTILLAGRADLCALARGFLYNPYLPLHAISEGQGPADLWPKPYLAGARPPASSS